MTNVTETVRPGHHSGDLLKLHISGYLTRVRWSRCLEAGCHRNIETIWLVRQPTPDAETIAEFGRATRDAFRRVFRKFVALCRIPIPSAAN